MTNTPIVNAKQIVADAKKHIATIDALMPELNKASQAGIDVSAQVAQAQQYKNQLQKLVSVYSQQ